MTLSVALLRGVNVGGAGKLSMADFRAALIAAGATDPETYIQSGNAVFGGRVSEEDLSDELRQRAGFRPVSVLLSDRTFLDILASNPFPDNEPKALHLFFLPQPAIVEEASLDAARSDEERWHLTDRVLYLFTPRFLTGSRLAPKLDRLLGVQATGRNWRTCGAIADMIKRRS